MEIGNCLRVWLKWYHYLLERFCRGFGRFWPTPRLKQLIFAHLPAWCAHSVQSGAVVARTNKHWLCSGCLGCVWACFAVLSTVSFHIFNNCPGMHRSVMVNAWLLLCFWVCFASFMWLWDTILRWIMVKSGNTFTVPRLLNAFLGIVQRSAKSGPRAKCGLTQH